MRVNPALRPYLVDIKVEDPSAIPTPSTPYTVLPGPVCVLGLQYRGRLEVLRESGPDLLERSGITGLQSTFRRFQAGAETRSVLVTLKPYGAYSLLGVSMNELADAHVSLASILPPRQARFLEERIGGADVDEIPDIVEGFFLDLLERSRRRPHPSVVEATERILAAHGNGSVEALAREMGISRRQLERLFKLQVGVGPKELASLARFERVLERLQAGLSGADLAYETGYSDQAHLIRSFVQRTGRTPGEHARG